MISSRLTILLLAALLASSCSAMVLNESPEAKQEADDQMDASESNVQQLTSQAAQTNPLQLKQVLTELVNNAYQLGQASNSYLDTQPEFTQSWADFPYAPGYLPAAFRSSYTPYQQQQSVYKTQGGALNPNSIGYGYIDWSGPVNPAVLYVPVNLPYYYRVPPQSVFYMPQPAIYKPTYQQPIVQQVKPVAYASKPAYTSAPQTYAAPQTYGAPQTYAAPQTYTPPSPTYSAPAYTPQAYTPSVPKY